MKKLLLIYLCSLLGINAIAQTTVTFKPDANIGKDAMIINFDDGCVPNDESNTPANINYGTHPEIDYYAWTFNSDGCNSGEARFLLAFTQLNTIPANAVITDVTLKLYGVSMNNTNGITVGNNNYSGSPYPLSNEGWLERVTQDWNESVVTWNSQPSFSTAVADIIPIEATDQQWDWNWVNNSATLKNMVQYWVNNPDQNYGFLVQLQNENYYRSVLLASSDNTNSALWPELTVTYTTADCDADFTYTVNSEDPDQINFEANTVVSGWTYSWQINGQNYSGSQVDYTNQSDTPITVCLDVTPAGSERSCTKCLTISSVTGVNDIVKNSGIASLTLYPNPTDNDWNIKMQSLKNMNAVVQVYDMVGRLLSSSPLLLHVGTQNFSVQASGLSSGMYMVVIKDTQNRLLAKIKALRN